jgi:ribosomal protein S18 acetylase RimI-like enzyme
VGRVTVRPARPDDDAELRRIDLATWSSLTSPSPPPAGSPPFFDERTLPEHVLVAELDGEVAGWIKLQPPTPLPASEHVLQVTGLAVDPARQGQGVGRALLEAAADEGRRRGARRLTLRVLAANESARRLYERCGFEVEGVLRGEFHLEGRDVDDVWMARRLSELEPE